jgi:ABC-2 type transport system ATP-binding protein
MKVIEVKNLSKSINGNQVLKDVNINVEEGQIYGFLGRNGAGKTTTLRTILGLLKKDAGEVKIFGSNISFEHFHNIGVVFEYETLNPDWSVIDNLRQTCYIYSIDEKEIFKFLKMFELEENDLKKKFSALSKGMKRKVSLISVLLPNPKLLICDEPTSGLDPEMQINIRNILVNFRANGGTVLFSSHNLYEVQKISNRVGIIQKGETLIEVDLKEPLYYLEGNFNKLAERKVKGKDYYIIPESELKLHNVENAKPVKDLEELYLLVTGGKDEVVGINQN